MSLLGLSTSNPSFNQYFWKHSKNVSKGKMTLTGILTKTTICLLLTVLTTSYVWKLFYDGNDIDWYLYGGMISGIICSIAISYKQAWAFWLVPFYALSKGLFLGAISVYTHKKFPDIPFQAIGMTLLTFFVMLFLFIVKIIKVNREFRSIIITASATIFTLYIISWILGFFGISVPFIQGTSWFSIVFNIIAAIVASLALLLDFDYIHRQLGRAPKRKEWIATWGLLVTLIWLYVEILRLLRKLAIRF